MFNGLNGVKFDSSAASVAAYVTQLSQLDAAQQKVMLSALGLSNEERAQAMAMVQATASLTSLTVAQFEHDAGLAAGTVQAELNKNATDQMTQADILHLLTLSNLTDQELACVASLLANTAAKETNAAASGAAATANMGLASSFKAVSAAMLATPMGWISLILMVVPAVIALGKAFKSAYDAAHPALADLQTELTSMQEELDSLEGKQEDVASKIEELNKLKDSGDITSSQEAELGRLERENELISQQIQMQEHLIDLKKQEVREKAGNDVEKFMSGTDVYDSFSGAYVESTGVAELRKTIADYNEARSNLEQATADAKNADADHADAAKEKVAKYTTELGEYTERLSSWQSKLTEWRSSLDETEDAGLVSQIDEWLDAISEAIGDTSDFTAITEDMTEAEVAAAKALQQSTTAMNQAKTALAELKAEQTAVNSALDEAADGGTLTLDTYESLLESASEYASCVEFENGVMQLNAEKARELTQAKAEAKIAELDLAKAQDLAKWKENAAAIEELTSAHGELTAEQQNELAALQESQGTLEENINKYNIMKQEILELTGAYQNWVKAHSGSETGDLYDSLRDGALKDITEGLESGKTGTDKFKMAVELMIPEANREDVAAYVESLERYLTEDASGVSNFIHDMVTAGLMIQDGDNVQLVDGATVQQICDTLHITPEMAKAIFGELEEYDFNFEWTEEDFAPEVDTEALDAAKQKLEEAKEKYLELQAALNDPANVDVTTEDVEAAKQEVKDAADEVNKLQPTVKADMDVKSAEDKAAELDKRIDELKAHIQELKDQDATIGINLNEAEIAAAEAELAALEDERRYIDVETETDTSDTKSELENLQGDLDELAEKIDTVAAKKIGGLGANTTILQLQSVIRKLQQIDGYKIKDKTFKVTQVNVGGNTPGFSSAGGTDSAPGGRTLVGELGRELVVSGSHYYTVGDMGAEFVNLKAGDIVFNHKDTEKIFAGMRGARGFALAYGNAAANISGGGNLRSLTGFGSANSSSSSGKSTSNSKVDINVKSDDKSIEDALKEKLDEMKDQIGDLITDYEHSIFLMDKQNAPTEQIIAVYRQMQSEVHKMAQEYRAMGLDENSEYIQEMQKQWWDYEDSVADIRKKEFDDWVDDAEFLIEMLTHDGAGTDELLEHTQVILDSVNQQIINAANAGLDYTDDTMQALIEKSWEMEENLLSIREEAFDQWVSYQEYQLESYTHGQEDCVTKTVDTLTRVRERALDELQDLQEQGIDDSNEYYQKVQKQAWAASKEIVEAYENMAEAANSAMDDIQGAFNSLVKAQEEYNDTGYITVDTFQEILSYGPQYLSLLMDENGQLVINEQAVVSLMEAKLDEITATQTAAYLSAVWEAAMSGDAAMLDALAGNMQNATSEAWSLVSALEALIDASDALTDSQKESVKTNVKRIGDLAKTVKSGIGSAVHSAMSGGGGGGGGGSDSNDEAKEQLDAVQDIIKWVEELIKHEHEEMIDALDDQLDHYEEIIDAKKKSLDLTKTELSYSKKISKATTNIAKLQARIDALSLDNSREAAIERAKLIEELSEMQEDLEEEQWDHANDLQSDALDEQKDAYSDMIKQRQKEIENQISSEQKLYDLAIDRIDNHWNELYTDLLNWNYEYGNSLTSDIVDAWGTAEVALQKYGDTLSAVAELSKLAASSGGGGGGGGGYGYSLGSSSSETEKQPSVHAIAKKIIKDFVSSEGLVGDTSTAAKTGRYGLSKADDEKVQGYVDEMKANSDAWFSASKAEREKLSNRNNKLGDKISDITGMDVYKDGNGVWWIGDDRLYDVYHIGGVVGGKRDERFSILQDGEWVLAADQIAKLTNVLNMASMLKDSVNTLSDTLPQLYQNELVAKSAKYLNNVTSQEGNTTVQVDASLSVSGVNDDEILRAIKDHPRAVAEVVARQFK